MPSLVQLLSPGSGEAVCLSATLALANICLHAANGPLVIAAGVLGPIFKLLKSQSVEVQTQAMCVPPGFSQQKPARSVYSRHC